MLPAVVGNAVYNQASVQPPAWQLRSFASGQLHCDGAGGTGVNSSSSTAGSEPSSISSALDAAMHAANANTVATTVGTATTKTHTFMALTPR